MSDGEYDDHGSDDDIAEVVNGGGGGSRGNGRAMVSRSKGREQARWEAAATSNWELHEGADGDIEGVLGGIEEAGKRKRCVLTIPFLCPLLTLVRQIAKRHHASATRYHSPHHTHPRPIHCDVREGSTAHEAPTDHQLHHRIRQGVLRAEPHLSTRDLGHA